MNNRCALHLLLWVCVTPLLGRPAWAGEATWVQIKSPHFTVFTDAGERRGREVAIRFEQMRAVFGNLLTQAKVSTPIPLEIVAFRNTKELRQVAPLFHGKPIELAGLFQGGSDRCFIMLDMAIENPWGVVFHEYAHQLMNGTLTLDLDPWFVEGFAEYFSSIEVDSRQARVGKIPPMTYEIIGHEGFMKIADLFKVQHNSATYNESGDKRTVFYAESSMVVHYIYDNDLFPKLISYFNLRYNKALPVEEAIQQGFGMSAAKFDNEIRSYVASNQFKYYPMKTPADIETTGYTSRPISTTDAAAVIADIHAHSPDYHDQALAEFEAVLKTDPANATAFRGLGYAYLQKRDLEKAGDYFDKASKADSTDPRVHYYSGVLMNMKGSSNPSDLALVIDQLKTAVALDPEFADSYMQLANAQGRAGDIPGAIANAKKAISLDPRSLGYYFNLANLDMQSGKTEEALAIFRKLSKSGDANTAAMASSSIGRIEQMKAYKSESTPVERAEAENSEPAGLHLSAPPPSANPATSTPKFLKGTILRVDCASAPGATLTVASAGKNWKLQVGDNHHVLVLGADGFSCNWSKQKVAINYVETGESAGHVISIEIQ